MSHNEREFRPFHSSRMQSSVASRRLTFASCTSCRCCRHARSATALYSRVEKCRRAVPYGGTTRWTNRNATMHQGNQSAASLYLLWGFMFPLPSDENPPPSDFSIVFTVEYMSFHSWSTAHNNAFFLQYFHEKFFVEKVSPKVWSSISRYSLCRIRQRYTDL